MDYLIRTATLKDLPAIMKIEHHGFIPEIQESRKTFETRIILCPQSFLVFEDKLKGSILGYICGELMEELPQSPAQLALGHNPKNQNPEWPYFYISSFSILPEYRGKGTGKQLWDEAIGFYQKNFSSEKKLLLLVNEVWEGARHIYKKNGFTEINCFKEFFPSENGFYTNGILMEK